VVHAYAGEIPRWKLVALLGRSGSGVSRLLKVLEKDGLVVRLRAPWNGRMLIAKLTDKGRELVESALAAIRSGEVEEVAHAHFSTSPETRERDAACFQRALLYARVSLGDRAVHEHPWAALELFDDDGPFLLQRPIPEAPRSQPWWERHTARRRRRPARAAA
jgi:DNA-binding MarR family transcriptional regulator